MEKRKLVKSGLFSYTIALPKDWVIRHKLGKGSTIYIDEQSGDLLLTPDKIIEQPASKEKEKVLYIDGVPAETILRDITAAHLMNINTICLKGDDLKKNIATFKKRISEFTGLEVIEETSDSLLIKDFVNINELNVHDLIKREDNIIRSMFLDTTDCLKNNDSNLAEAIRGRDKEVNRLAFMIYKCLNYIEEHPQQWKNHGVHPAYVAHVWEINGYLEKIGDEVKRIAMLVPETKLKPSERKDINSLIQDVEGFYKEQLKI